jgi:hypothetical protein
MGRRTYNHSHKSTYEWTTDKIVYKNICFECGKDNTIIHYHHIVPEIRGGKSTIPLCSTCHGLVHDRNFDHHRELQRIGIERAKLQGKYKGRKVGSTETVNEYLNKERIKKIGELLNSGYGVRETCRVLKCSPNTIAKFKKHNVEAQKS